MRIPGWLFILIIGAMVLATAIRTGVQAQDTPQPPLIVMRQNDETLYTVDVDTQVVTPLDFCTAEDEARVWNSVWLSPDGFKFAWVSHGNGDQWFEQDIRICDLQTQRLINVTEQVDGNDYATRSIPAWSPDGTHVAYTQLLPAESILQFAIYDLETGETRYVYESPFSVNDQSIPPRPSWSPLGIVILNIEYSSVGDTYLFYPDPSSAQESYLIQSIPDSYNFGYFAVNLHEPTGYAYLLYDDDSRNHYVLDLETNTVNSEPAYVPFFMNLFAPEGVTAHIDDVMGSVLNYWWLASDELGGMSLFRLVAWNTETLAISPNGERIAFVSFENPFNGGKLYIASNLTALVNPTYGEPIEGLVRISELDSFWGENGVFAVYWGGYTAAYLPERVISPEG